ncbi:reverse transcriptase domain-containing protein [Tanacetum coccineum]
MYIELANKTTQYPRGIAENDIVKIDKFVFPVDFVVLDIEEDHKVPIILGRPFLATAHAMIDVFNKKIFFKVGNDMVPFDIEKSMEFYSPEDDTYLSIDMVDLTILDHAHDILPSGPLDLFLFEPTINYQEDDEPMWAADRVVAPTPSSAITIPETANEFAIKDTFMELKTKFKTTTKNHQASIQSLEAKFDRLADKQSGRPSGSLPSNTQPNPKGSSSKLYQPPQARNEHVNVVFTRSGKSYDPPINPNDQQNNFETSINFDSEDEEEDKAFPCNALADLGASINLMPYSLHAKLSLGTLKPTKMSVRLANRSFQHPIGIAENMLVKVGNVTFLVDFVILKIEEDIGTEQMTFTIDSSMKHSYLNDDTCFSIDVIDEILEEDFDALLDEGSEILHSIGGTILKEKLFAEFDEFMAMNIEEDSDSEYKTEEPPFEKIALNTEYKIKTSLKEPPSDLELKPLPNHLEYVFLVEPSFLPIIISSHLSKKNKIIFMDTAYVDREDTPY